MPVVSRCDQRDAIAVRVGQSAGRSDAGLRDRQMLVSEWRRLRQWVAAVVDLQHRLADTVPQLMYAAPNRKRLVERQTDLTLPEREHRILVDRL